MKKKRSICVLHSEKPWWLQEIDEEMKRQLTINDKPSRGDNEQRADNITLQISKSH